MKLKISILILLTSMYRVHAQNLVEVAADAGSFNTLIAAVQAAGLEDALRSGESLTVFAPTDDAFAKLPEGTVSALLADPDSLQDILLYHVAAGELDSSIVTNSPYLSMLSGQVAIVDVNEEGAFIAGAQISAVDIGASNGIIHVLDTVMIPPSSNIVETAVDAGVFSTLVAAVQAAGLADTLAEGGPFTVFAPTDEAFSKLPPGTVEALLADPAALANILLYHVVDGRVLAADVLEASRVTTLQGQSVEVSTEGGVFVNDAQVVATDILATNGVVHVIDSVLLPPEKRGTTYEVTVTNLTRGQVFSPPAIVAHSASVSLFTLGQPASSGLSALAEDGARDALVSELQGVSAIFDIGAFDAPIRPGQTAQATVQVGGKSPIISIAGMLTATNDSFFAASLSVGSGLFGKVGRDKSDLAWAYDAGTEFNSESCAFIPGAECGAAGERDTTDAEGYVYFSNGVHGTGDLDQTIYDWRGPVAQVSIRRR